jgi:hypothetical protein
MNNNIIFIGGTGRCGTNILKDILALHPDVATLPFEYRFIIDPDGLVDYYSQTTWSPYMADRKLKRLENLLYDLSSNGFGIYKDWELDGSIPNYFYLFTELIHNLRGFVFEGSWVGSEDKTMQYFSPIPKKILAKILGDFIWNVVNNILEKQGKKIYVEDNTWNILFAKELFELVPGAKLIHVTRNYLDVIASFKKQKWCPSDTTQAATMYRDIIRRWLEIRDGLNYNSYFEFEFEDLINETERMIKRICSFIGIAFNDNMLNIDLSKHNIGRHKSELTSEERKAIEGIL